MAEKLQLLVVEDDEDDYFLIRHLLQSGVKDAQIERAASVDDALERTAQTPYDLFLLDYRLGDKDGLELLRELKNRDQAAPVIFLTGQGDEEVAVQAMKAGAIDYLPKSKLSEPSLSLAVRYAVNLKSKEEAVRAARRALHASERRFRALVENSSDAMVLLDTGGTVLYVSQSIRRLLGYRPEEFVESCAFDFIHPDDVANARQLFSVGLQSPEVPLRGEYRVRHQDGGWRVLETTLSNRLNDPAVGAVVVNERDVTERKRMEEALRASEREYRTLFENANDAIMIFEAGTEVILEANPRACEMYGFSHQELLGTSLKRLSRDPERGEQAIAETLQTGSLKDFETVHYRKDGSVLYVLVNASAIDYRGRKAVLSISRDISERKQAEKEIFRLNRALQAQSKCSQAVLQAKDEQQLLEEICNIMVQVGGYRMAWVAARIEGEDSSLRPVACAGCDRGFLHAAGRLPEAARRQLPGAAVLRSGQPVACRDIAADGRFAELEAECASRGYASMIALPLLVDANVFGALVMYASEKDAFDAAEVELLRELADNVAYGIGSLRARAQRAIAEAESRKLYSAVEQSAEVVVITDRNGVIEYVNPAFESLTGYSRQEAVGNTPRILKSGKHPADFYQNLWGTVLRGEVFRDVVINRKKNGDLFYSEKTITPVVNGQSEITHFISNDRDITERRALEERLRHSQKMDAVGQLAGGVAHDFNNLLMVISSYAELLSGGLQHDAKAQRQAEQILNAARRAAGLIRQLLAFSRKQVLAPRILDLNSVLADFGRMLPRLIGEDVKVELKPGTELWRVKADPVQIEQVLMNLAVNARDAMPRGGVLTLETANVHLDEAYARRHAGVAAGDYVMVAVSDTGEGIPPEILPRIFEPFFTTKEQGKGTGLGLPTAYGIVKQSGGSIWVYSEAGKGTVFKVYLPQTEQKADVAPAQAAAEPAPRGSETILLVEDEEAVRESAGEYLSLRGYTVLQAKDGGDALQVLEHYPAAVDLLVTDVIMPGMSGRELAARISQTRPAIRVLYVSGYNEAMVERHGIDAGSSFLQKPFSLSALGSRVRELLDAAAAVRAARVQ